MKLIHDIGDFGNVTDTFCNGIGSITDLGNGIIRVTYYAVREDNEDRVNMVVDQQIWSQAAFLASLEAAHVAVLAMQQPKPRLVAAGMH